jgi:hypothetical protein
MDALPRKINIINFKLKYSKRVQMRSRNSFGNIFNKLTIIELVLIMVILGMVIYLMYKSFKSASSFGATAPLPLKLTLDPTKYSDTSPLPLNILGVDNSVLTTLNIPVYYTAVGTNKANVTIDANGDFNLAIVITAYTNGVINYTVNNVAQPPQSTGYADPAAMIAGFNVSSTSNQVDCITLQDAQLRGTDQATLADSICKGKGYTGGKSAAAPSACSTSSGTGLQYKCNILNVTVTVNSGVNVTAGKK